MDPTGLHCGTVAISIDPALLAGLVVGGVGLVVGLTHARGGSTPTLLSSEAEARQRYLADFPHATIEALELADDRRAALLQLSGGGSGLVWVLGHHAITRRLEPGQLRLRAGPDGLWIHVTDPGLPELFLSVADPDQRERWRRWLEA